MPLDGITQVEKMAESQAINRLVFGDRQNREIEEANDV